MGLNGLGAGTPDGWDGLVQKSDQVKKVNLQAIHTASLQFKAAAENAGDQSAALKKSTDALNGGVWSGPAADAFFEYVRSITKAGENVESQLIKVVDDLDRLHGQLGDIKSKVNDAFLGAEKAVNDRNAKAQTEADAAKTAAAQAEKDHKPAPSPSAAEIIQAAKTDINKITSDADTRVKGLLDQANQMIKTSQDLMQKDIPNGYSKVPMPGKDGSVPKRTGGIHTGGGGGGGGEGGGGGGGGGGGLGPSGGPPSTTPPGNVQQWILEAIKILQANGIPVTEADINKIWTIIEKESGGNPNAINNWDSNAAKGTPSKGLMQCIDPTFNAHKLPGHDDIYNPVDNIIAGVRYTFSRYGGFDGHPGLKSMAGGGGYQGY